MNCFVLSFQVRPDGELRESSHFVLNSLEEVQSALLDNLCDPMSMYLTVYYGRKITLWGIENDEVTKVVNAKRYIRFKRLDYDIGHDYDFVFRPGEYGALAHWDASYGETPFDFNDFAEIRGNRVVHTIYEVECLVPKLKPLKGNAGAGSVIRLPTGIVRFPQTDWVERSYDG